MIIQIYLSYLLFVFVLSKYDSLTRFDIFKAAAMQWFPWRILQIVAYVAQSLNWDKLKWFHLKKRQGDIYSISYFGFISDIGLYWCGSGSICKLRLDQIGRWRWTEIFVIGVEFNSNIVLLLSWQSNVKISHIFCHLQ